MATPVVVEKPVVETPVVETPVVVVVHHSLMVNGDGAQP